MGWFNQEKKEKENIPSLPEFPKLPELPKFDDENDSNEEITKLPSLPNNMFGEKFSRNAIKDAVSGQEEDLDADDFKNEEYEMRMMREPLKKPMIKEVDSEFDSFKMKRDYPNKINNLREPIKKSGPVFIRIDNFEESLNVLREAEMKISEIEKSLKEIREIREKEELELNSWEKEIQSIKEQFEKIDKEVFSKM